MSHPSDTPPRTTLPPHRTMMGCRVFHCFPDNYAALCICGWQDRPHWFKWIAVRAARRHCEEYGCDLEYPPVRYA